MDHVSIMASDPHFRWNERVILDLHFDACSFQHDKLPGRSRSGPVYVTGFAAGPPDYEGPVADAVPDLMAEVCDWLQTGDLDAHVAVRAAMAHLQFVSVHPFNDGHGRISRIVQSLVLGREQLLVPDFWSIEEYLGHHTAQHYAVLREVQAGHYQPQRDAEPWVRFCVEAHIAQARHRLHQIAEAKARWVALERLVERRGWPDRLVIALEQSLFDATDRGSYSAAADIALPTATSDLRRLQDAGLLTRIGRTRSTRYVASAELRRIGPSLGTGTRRPSAQAAR